MLACNDEEKLFLNKWYKKKLLKIENNMVDFWVEMCLDLNDIEIILEDKKLDEKLKFSNMMSNIFEKYMQAALYEMVIKINADETKLTGTYFVDLPISALQNTDNFNLFENYVETDLKIEIVRALKLEIIQNIILIETEENYLKDLEKNKA